MKKNDFVKLVAENGNVAIKTAGDAINATFEEIASALEKGDSISFPGFGSFKVVNRAAREGRNPSTGEKIHIPASKAVKFTPGANLKERVNK